MQYLVAFGCLLLGVGVSWLGIQGTKAFVGVLTRTETDPKAGRGWVYMLTMTKIPIFLGAAWLATRPGPWGWGPFIAGVLLVYLAFIWSSFAKRSTEVPKEQ